jgi:hypothetical protein
MSQLIGCYQDTVGGTMNPTMTRLAMHHVSDHARSALPNAPVVPPPEPKHRMEHLRLAAARALRRAADQVEPAPVRSPAYG